MLTLQQAAAIQATFAHELITGTMVHEAEFTTRQQQLQLTICPELAMVISLDRYPDLAASKPVGWCQEIGQQLLKVLHQALSVPFVWCWVSEGVMVILLELLDGNENKHQDFAGQKARQIASEIVQHADEKRISVSIGIGGAYDNPLDMQHSYEEAQMALKDRFFQGNQLVLPKRTKQDRDSKSRRNSSILSKNRADVIASVRIGDERATLEALRTLLHDMTMVDQQDVESFQSEVVEIITAMSRTVLELGADASTILAENARFIQDLYKTIRYDTFLQKVERYSISLVQQGEQLGMKKYSPVIRNAVLYVKEHLGEKIGLNEVAQNCCLSVYHFSHLFQRETGYSFIEYVHHMKLQKAVIYLETTDLSIKEIAFELGFEDANYFSRLFKRHMNMSPREYRTARLC
ncbi:AraC family transcriptional regulator [Brevibacillus laterosporus]|uniref:AraC family transcriptional regulator n=1 Tax=Brevibacillus laterosporus TaxID=1465 RepID=A0AAP8QCU6_BRELA|nr:helix-turn-helix domain-containing protein [Brevibacillus laterosporus]MED1664080.1 AraC family transcriptional regulator [Brevibacillus laterosporus]MED1669408.1 AraC family transcriptional regulator [Brevibacillus laterosporus]MED1716863.1 AraC family transcriptional regulator [Brevibacillus laterosporus]PPA85989.1 AraC family transcriptional regulator [Brevibacillus laterosporus]PPB02276.1 AraC family transcriptional regulator [Brevibacillus laterosporus]